MQMAQNKLGRHSFRPGQPVYIAAWASVAGKKEAEGPLGHGFDIKSMDTKFGEKTWEQAEKKMQQLALEKLLYKSKLQNLPDLPVIIGDQDILFSLFHRHLPKKMELFSYFTTEELGLQ